MVRLEELTDQQLCALTGDFEKLRARLVKPEASGEAE